MNDDKLYKLSEKPQKDGTTTGYKCGLICVGRWADRIEQWKGFTKTNGGKYIMELENRDDQLLEKIERIQDLSTRYFTIDIRMNAGLMKGKVLEILNELYEPTT